MQKKQSEVSCCLFFRLILSILYLGVCLVSYKKHSVFQFFLIQFWLTLHFVKK